MRIGLISDTHNRLRPQALAQLAGSDHIIHAGDICDADVLDALEKIAPVTAVRGNNDRGAWAARLRETEWVRFGSVCLYVIHDVARMEVDPAGCNARAVVFGHSHKPSVEQRGGTLYVNPGSAGPRRFKLPISVGELRIDGNAVSARIIELAAD